MSDGICNTDYTGLKWSDILIKIDRDIVNITFITDACNRNKMMNGWTIQNHCFLCGIIRNQSMKCTLLHPCDFCMQRGTYFYFKYPPKWITRVLWRKIQLDTVFDKIFSWLQFALPHDNFMIIVTDRCYRRTFGIISCWSIRASFIAYCTIQCLNIRPTSIKLIHESDPNFVTYLNSEDNVPESCSREYYTWKCRRIYTLLQRMPVLYHIIYPAIT